MNYYYRDIVTDDFVSRSSYLSDLRDLKFNIISGDYQFVIDNNALESLTKELRFISDKFPNDILSGSIVLKLFGLLDREYRDIDIITNDVERYKLQYYKGNRYGHSEADMDRRLGYVDFKYRHSGFLSLIKPKSKYTVDFFENKDESYIDLNFEGKNIKIHNPLSIIEFKMGMGKKSEILAQVMSDKHNYDLYKIFGRISALNK